jgi:hypothetical protein
MAEHGLGVLVGPLDPWPMLEFIRGRASDRKLRPFGVACVRDAWDRLADERSRAACGWRTQAKACGYHIFRPLPVWSQRANCATPKKDKNAYYFPMQKRPRRAKSYKIA